MSAMDNIIAAFSDRRLWNAANNVNDLVKVAMTNGCDCSVCIQLRAIGGFLDDMKAQYAGEGE